MPLFKYNDSEYDVAPESVKEFISAAPEAEQIMKFATSDGGEYQVAMPSMKEFLDASPDAKPILTKSDESYFQNWYSKQAKRLNLDPDPDSGKIDYDYRRAWISGEVPGALTKIFDPKNLTKPKYQHSKGRNLLAEADAVNAEVVDLLKKKDVGQDIISSVQEGGRVKLSEEEKQKLRITPYENLAKKFVDLESDLNDRPLFQAQPKEVKDNIHSRFADYKATLMDFARRKEITPQERGVFDEIATGFMNALGSWSQVYASAKEASGIMDATQAQRDATAMAEAYAPSWKAQEHELSMAHYQNVFGAGAESILESVLPTKGLQLLGRGAKVGTALKTLADSKTANFLLWAMPSGAKVAGQTYDTAMRSMEEDPNLKNLDWGTRNFLAITEGAISGAVEIASEKIGFETWGKKFLKLPSPKKAFTRMLQDGWAKTVKNVTQKALSEGAKATMFEFLEEEVSSIGQDLASILHGDSDIVKAVSGDISLKDAAYQAFKTTADNFVGVLSTFALGAHSGVTKFKAQSIERFVKNPAKTLAFMGITNKAINDVAQQGVHYALRGDTKGIESVANVLTADGSIQSKTALALMSSAQEIHRARLKERGLEPGEEIDILNMKVPEVGQEKPIGEKEKKPAEVKIPETVITIGDISVDVGKIKDADITRIAMDHDVEPEAVKFAIEAKKDKKEFATWFNKTTPEKRAKVFERILKIRNKATPQAEAQAQKIVEQEIKPVEVPKAEVPPVAEAPVAQKPEIVAPPVKAEPKAPEVSKVPEKPKAEEPTAIEIAEEKGLVKSINDYIAKNKGAKGVTIRYSLGQNEVGRYKDKTGKEFIKYAKADYHEENGEKIVTIYVKEITPKALEKIFDHEVFVHAFLRDMMESEEKGSFQKLLDIAETLMDKDTVSLIKSVYETEYKDQKDKENLIKEEILAYFVQKGNLRKNQNRPAIRRFINAITKLFRKIYGNDKMTADEAIDKLEQLFAKYRNGEVIPEVKEAPKAKEIPKVKAEPKKEEPPKAQEKPKEEAPQAQGVYKEAKDLIDVLVTLVAKKTPAQPHAKRVMIENIAKRNKTTQKEVEEVIERAIVEKANEIARSSFPIKGKWQQILDLYEAQPTLSTRTGTSTRDQAYSTPVPLAFLISIMNATEGEAMYEPTAGNGMLMIGADKKTSVANELNPARADNLKKQGFNTIVADATTTIPANKFPKVIMNPPFGAIGETFVKFSDKVSVLVSKLEHQIAVNALRAMKPDGVATMIFGANRDVVGNFPESEMPFWEFLYNNFNVVSNFEVDGDLYGKQGAKFPVRVVTVNGLKKTPTNFRLARKSNQGGYAFLKQIPGKAIPEATGEMMKNENRAETWEEVKKLTDETAVNMLDSKKVIHDFNGDKMTVPYEQEMPKEEEVKKEEPKAPKAEIPKPPKAEKPPKTEAPKAPPKAEPTSTLANLSADKQAKAKEIQDKLKAILNKPRPAVELEPEEKKNLLNLGVELANLYVESGVKTFKQFATNVKADMADAWDNVKTYLHGIWQVAGADNAELDDVSRADAKKIIDELSVVKKKEQEKPEQPIPQVPQQEKEATKNQVIARLDAPAVPRGEGQVENVTASNVGSFKTLTPTYLAKSTKKALKNLVNKYKDVDNFIMQKLGYGSKEELGKAFAAEQVDSTALAIDNYEKGTATIIGHQTGIGKGRVAAAMIRYCKRNGIIPVFITAKPALFTDMKRDLNGIGEDIEPFIIANPKDGQIFEYEAQDETEEDSDIVSEVVAKPLPSSERNTVINNIIDNGWEDGRQYTKGVRKSQKFVYDSVFITYDQLNRRDNAQQKLMRNLAKNNKVMFIMDEAHKASGKDSWTGLLFKGGVKVIDKALAEKINNGNKKLTVEGIFENKNNAYPNVGTVYLSATFAKRPDNMPLYIKTSLRYAADIDHLPLIIESGGLRMQQYISEALAEAGEMLRYERDFSGSTVEMVNLSKEESPEMEADVTEVTDALRRVIDFAKDLDDQISKIGGGILERYGIEEQVEGEAFSVVHNVITQMLLAVKAQSVANRALKTIDTKLSAEDAKANPKADPSGHKVIIGVENTMGSFIEAFAKEFELNPGMDMIDKDGKPMTFKHVIISALQSQLKVHGTDHNGERVTGELNESDLKQLGMLDEYNSIIGEINGLESEIPVSPIDFMEFTMEEKGVKVGEITGRKHGIKYYKDANGKIKGKYHVRSGEEVKQKQLIVRDFQDGEYDALVVNTAAAEGISLHASESDKEGKDKKRRVMMIAQPARDVNSVMQLFGRVLRSGQVIGPIYELIATHLQAEIRPMIMLLKKLKSLNANTTASSKTALTVEAADILNHYGDQVVTDYLADDEDAGGQLADDMGITIDRKDGVPDVKKDIAKIFTGHIAVLPNYEQEKIYGEILAKYNDLIENEKRSGSYDLDFNYRENWEVEEVGKEQIVEKGTDNTNPFKSDVSLKKLSIKVTKKAPTMEEAEAKAKKNMPSGLAQAIQNLKIAIQAKYEAYIEDQRKWRKDKEGKDSSWFMDAESTKAKTIEFIDSLTEHVKMEYMFADASMSEFMGMITNVKHTSGSGNPYAPSKLSMEVTIADQIGHLKFTLSEMKHNDMTLSRISPVEAEDAFEDAKKRNNMREERYAFVGNVIRGIEITNVGIAKQGKLERYKDKNGVVNTVYLMNKDWHGLGGGTQQNNWFKNGKEAIAYISDTNDIAVSVDISNQIFKDEGTEYQKRTPKIIIKKDRNYVNGEIKRGIVIKLLPTEKQLYQDKALVDIIGGEFEKRSNVYNSPLISEEVAERVIDYIMETNKVSLISGEIESADEIKRKQEIRDKKSSRNKPMPAIMFEEEEETTTQEELAKKKPGYMTKKVKTQYDVDWLTRSYKDTIGKLKDIIAGEKDKQEKIQEMQKELRRFARAFVPKDRRESYLTELIKMTDVASLETAQKYFDKAMAKLNEIIADEVKRNAISRLEKIADDKAVDGNYAEQLNKILAKIGVLKTVKGAEKIVPIAERRPTHLEKEPVTLRDFLKEELENGDINLDVYGDNMDVLYDLLGKAQPIDIEKLSSDEIMNLMIGIEALYNVGRNLRYMLDAYGKESFRQRIANMVQATRNNNERARKILIRMKKLGWEIDTEGNMIEVKGMKDVARKNLIHAKELFRKYNYALSPKSEYYTPAQLSRMAGTWENLKSGKLGKFLEGYHFANLKAETLINFLDGMEGVNGTVYNALFMEYKGASDNELVLGGRIVEEMINIIEPISNNLSKIRSTYKRHQVKIGDKWYTRENLMAIYANSLNENNLKHLMMGNKLTQEEIAEAVSKITPEEKKVIDNIMKLIDGFYEQMAEITEELTGMRPRREENYFPIVMDTDFNAMRYKQIEEGESDMLRQTYEQVFLERGFSKERKGGTGALDLDFFGVTSQHLHDIIHYNTHAMPVHNIKKIIYNKEFQDAAIGVIGKEGYKQLHLWLKNITNPDYQIMKGGLINKIAGAIRRSAVTMALGFRLSTGIKQLGGWFQIASRIGAFRTMQGIVTYGLNPNASLRFIEKNSPAVKFRARSWDREYRNFMNIVSKSNIFKGNLQLADVWFVFIKTADLYTVRTGWMGAYETGRAEAYRLGITGENAVHGYAVNFADSIIRQTQPAGSPGDMSAIQTGTETERLFTMFITFFNAMYNENVKAFRAFGEGKMGVANLSLFVLYTAVLPAIYEVMINMMMSPPPEEKDWRKTPMNRLMLGLATYNIQQLPFINALSTPLLQGYEAKFSPALSMIADTIKAFAPTSKGEFVVDKAYWNELRYNRQRELATAVGMFSGLAGKPMPLPAAYSQAKLLFPTEVGTPGQIQKAKIKKIKESASTIPETNYDKRINDAMKRAEERLKIYEERKRNFRNINS